MPDLFAKSLHLDYVMRVCSHYVVSEVERLSNMKRFTYTHVLAIVLALSTMALTSAPSWQTAAPFPQAPAWSSPENVSTSVEVDSEAPALAVAGNGVVHLVWEEGDEVYHAHRTAGVWSTPTQIPGTGSADQPAVAAGDGDQLHVVYADYSDIYRVSWDGSTWGLPHNVSQHDVGSSHSPDLAVAEDGTLHIVAVEATSQQLYYADVATASYSPIPNAFFGGPPSIDVAGVTTKTIHIAYRNTIDSNIYTVRRKDGAWDLPGGVTNSPEQFSTAPELALDASREAHIVWRETISDTDQVQYAHGPTWSPIRTLSNSPAGTTLPALTVDGLGVLHAGWGDGASPTFTLLHTWASSPDDWVPPAVAHAVGIPIEDVALFGTSDGVVHGTWLEGSPGDVWYASQLEHRVLLPLVLRQ